MSLMQDGKLKPWKTFKSFGRKLNKGINSERTILMLVPKLSQRVLDDANGNEDSIRAICSLGPKRLWKMGLLTGSGYRRGFTK